MRYTKITSTTKELARRRRRQNRTHNGVYNVVVGCVGVGEAWNGLRTCSDFEKFLKIGVQYPSGTTSPLAHLRVQQRWKF
jgi:hypothetical protein